MTAGSTRCYRSPVLQIEMATAMAEPRALFLEYAAGLGVDLSFQNFDEEIANLPGDYEVILLARDGDELAGCVALRRLEADCCEMKRLYIRQKFRGRGAGRALAERIIGEARSRGYARMRLDSLPSMTEAISLYRSLGFADIAPYRRNPIAHSVFMELQLRGRVP